MLVDVIRHQHACVRNAVAQLASLDGAPHDRLARALAEITRAFAEGTPVWAERELATIRRLAGDPRAAGFAQRLGALAVDERGELTAAVVDLYTVSCREYWTA